MKKPLKFIFRVGLGVVVLFFIINFKLPPKLSEFEPEVSKPQVLSRNGEPLNITYQNNLNLHNQVALSKIPIFLQNAFIVSEDKNFYTHHGIDFKAKIAALWQGLSQWNFFRGASSISEQCVRILHPRSRNIFNKLLEMLEASLMEIRNSKSEILEFYLNQVPYAHNILGVKAAALSYFGRDLGTLNKKEMLALAILVRAPSRFDLRKKSSQLADSIENLARRMYDKNHINFEDLMQISQRSAFKLNDSQHKFYAPDFVKFVLNNHSGNSQTIHTTLDENLQTLVSQTLTQDLKKLKKFKVNNAAALVVDIKTAQVLAYAQAGFDSYGNPNKIDIIHSPRSPGSSLKPFVYAQAFEQGASGATLVNDTPLIQSIGFGQHDFRNYSETFYGLINLRQALGNSLNIPALKLAQFVGLSKIYNFLQSAGITSLSRDVDYYGAGLAIGSAPISLWDLVQAYGVLASGGFFKKLSYRQNENHPAQQILSAESANMVTDILSDNSARTLEFGLNSPLNFSYPLATKTGTSSGYHDAWIVGYDSNYLVGVWFGNLNFEASPGLTGAKGPASTLRSIFAHLNTQKIWQDFKISSQLKMQKICNPEKTLCYEDYVNANLPLIKEIPDVDGKIITPTANLRIVISPRVPRHLQSYNFSIAWQKDYDSVEWWLNEKLEATTKTKNYLWDLQAGNQQLCVNVLHANKKNALGCIDFTVN